MYLYVCNRTLGLKNCFLVIKVFDFAQKNFQDPLESEIFFVFKVPLVDTLNLCLSYLRRGTMEEGIQTLDDRVCVCVCVCVKIERIQKLTSWD